MLHVPMAVAFEERSNPRRSNGNAAANPLPFDVGKEGVGGGCACCARTSAPVGRPQRSGKLELLVIWSRARQMTMGTFILITLHQTFPSG